MKRNITISLSVFLIFSFMASACSGLLSLEDEPVTGDFGPAYTPQELQARTFEALWTNLQDNYIYFDSADVDWDSIRDRYLERINSGLTNKEFTELLDDLESELPAGSITYQSRAERIETDIGDLSSYEGIGAFVGFNEDPQPHVVLLGVIEGSPAEKAGLKAHDSIFAIDGSPVLVEEGLRVVDRIRGPSGSSVTLNVQTPGSPERSVEVKRAKLTSTGKLEALEIPDTSYAYMLFPPVAYPTMMDDVVANLQTFTTNKTLDGLILDLRVAGSSRDWPFEALFTMFYNGTIGEFYNREGKQPLEVKGQDV
jgi:C-terminal processing protease CtpA/Prc